MGTIKVKLISLLLIVGLLMDPMGVFVVAQAKDKPIEHVENKPTIRDDSQRLVVTLKEKAKIGDFAGQFKIRSRYPRQNKLLIEVENPVEVIQALLLREDVVSVTYDHDLRLSYIPEEAYYASYQWNLKDIGSESVWDITKGNPSVIIAVIDTGVGPYSDFGLMVNGADMTGITVLEDTYPGQYSSDGGFHGTAVASLISSQMNTYGIAGLAPGVAIMPIKVFPTGSGTASTLTVAEGVVWAVDHGADIINLSLGGDDPQSELENAIGYATAQGVMVVAASGNDGYTNRISYPARYDGVIAVGSSNQGKQVSSFSNKGPGLDIVAPGEGVILYYRLYQQFNLFNGTSFSAPTVAAALGLLESAFPTLSDDLKMRLLYSGADDYGNSGLDIEYGYGIVNIWKSFSLAQSASVIDKNDTFATAEALVQDVMMNGRFDLVLDPDIYTFSLSNAQPVGLTFDSLGSLGVSWGIYDSSMNPITEEDMILGSGVVRRTLNLNQGNYYVVLNEINDTISNFGYSLTLLSADSTPPIITMTSKGIVLENGGTSDEDVVVEVFDETEVEYSVTRDDIVIEWPVDGRFVLNGNYHLEAEDAAGNTSIVSFAILKSGTYPVSFVTQSDLIPDIDVEYGTTIGSLNAPVRTGYVFSGWYTDTAYTIPWSLENDLVVNAMTLYAKWVKERYTITFNTLGGSLVGSQTVDYGSLLYRPANPTRSGYFFENWYRDSSYTQVWDFSQPVQGIGTIVAKWIFAPVTTTGLKLASTSISSIGLSWAPQSVVGYEIYRASGTSTSYTKIAESTTAAYTSAALVAGVNYSYKVRAFTLVNNQRVYGAFSAIASGKPIPSTPIVTGIALSYNSSKISWPAVTGATAYQIYRATSATGSYVYWTSTTSTSYTNTYLTTNATYYYKVRAYRTLTSGRLYGNFSSSVAVKPIPAIPSALSLSVLSYTSVKATWAAVSGASGYEIYSASSANGTFTLASRITTTSLTLTNLVFNQPIALKVRAYRIINTVRIYGNFTSVSLVSPNVTAPTMSATSLSFDTIKLAWPAISGAQGYAIEGLDSSLNQFVEIGDTSSLSFNHGGRQTGINMTYRIRAYRFAGETKIYSKYSANIIAKAIPATVGSAKAMSQTYTSVKIEFAPVAGASGYEIFRYSSSTKTYLALATINTTNYINTSLNFNTTYYYKVRAFTLIPGGKVYGDFSSIVSAKTVLNTPTVAVGSASSSSLRLTWPGISGATAYQVYRASSVNGVYTRIITTTSMSFLNTGLSTGTMYYYKMRAYRTNSYGTYYGSFSIAIGGKPIPSAPILTVNVMSDSSLDVAWNAVVEASGYELSVLIDGQTEPVVTNTTSTQTKLNGLPYNVGINLRIRAYKIINSIKIYSEPSAWVNVMIPMTS